MPSCVSSSLRAARRNLIRLRMRGPDVQCRSEQTTGSLIIKSACTTRAQRAAQQIQLDDLKRAVDEMGAPPRPTGTLH